MTTMFPALKLCAACGETSEHMLISSTSSFGSMDLDTMPPPLARDTLAQEIQRCPSCGYCAPDISEVTGLDVDLFNDSDYQEVLKGSSGKPPLAREFEAAALLATRAARHADAGWFLLKAAWACDDEQAEADARAFRMKTLESWSLASSSAQSFAADATSEALIKVDITRRSLLFVEAMKLVEAQPVPDDEILAAILSFERHLSKMEDDDSHTVDEAVAALEAGII